MDVSKFSLITMLLLASATASEAMAPPWSDSLQRRGPLVSREEYGPAAGPRLGMARANDVPGGASVGEDHAHAHSVRGLTERAATESDRKDKGGGERSRSKRYFPTGFLGSPPAATSQTPLMVAQANNQDYHYMPLQDDGTVYVLDPCPAPSPPSGGGGSNVFALLTFSVVTANVLINAVANVNSNNNNNNNNDNNNNDNINNENVSSNLDSNTNDNTIMGRALASNASLPDASASCACSRRRRRTPSELPERLQAPQWLMSCVPRSGVRVLPLGCLFLRPRLRRGEGYRVDVELDRTPATPQGRAKGGASSRFFWCVLRTTLPVLRSWPVKIDR
ncbi:probable serine/threonine-protein kinase DDB_G0272282 [Penaeus monodon]|uniref:probable serine/threonine-protein kinase DDB_G0272282 n=1 Tax=Penaeus monodon TaxID=6687 RepID=UPI0018A7D6EF|nr:probable serine/threonine-protein kinase DDB_G0272282 [Penaeus monodon]